MQSWRSQADQPNTATFSTSQHGNSNAYSGHALDKIEPTWKGHTKMAKQTGSEFYEDPMGFEAQYNCLGKAEEDRGISLNEHHPPYAKAF